MYYPAILLETSSHSFPFNADHFMPLLIVEYPNFVKPMKEITVGNMIIKLSHIAEKTVATYVKIKLNIDLPNEERYSYATTTPYVTLPVVFHTFRSVGLTEIETDSVNNVLNLNELTKSDLTYFFGQRQIIYNFPNVFVARNILQHILHREYTETLSISIRRSPSPSPSVEILSCDVATQTCEELQHFSPIAAGTSSAQPISVDTSDAFVPVLSIPSPPPATNRCSSEHEPNISSMNVLLRALMKYDQEPSTSVNHK